MNTQSTRSLRWRTIDIVIAALVAVLGGVLFWAWSVLNGVMSAAFLAFPPSSGLSIGGWLLPAVLGGLLIRKPGAALFCELLAASGELIMGSQWGLSVLISGLIQGLGAELVFALARYRRFGLGIAVAAGAVAGLFGGVNDVAIFGWYVDYIPSWKFAYVLMCMASGAVIAGLLSWLLTRALAAAGALNGLASRQAHREKVTF